MKPLFLLSHTGKVLIDVEKIVKVSFENQSKDHIYIHFTHSHGLVVFPDKGQTCEDIFIKISQAMGGGR